MTKLSNIDYFSKAILKLSLKMKEFYRKYAFEVRLCDSQMQ